jgi:putative ABC transport system substrate-binding protein
VSTSKSQVFALVCCLFLIAPHFSSAAQQSVKIPRIGYVSGTGSATNPGPYVEALRQGLRDLGYAEGKHFLLEYRGAEGKPERFSSLVLNLIELNVDVLVVPTVSTARIAKQTTKTIPIVMVTPGDPVAEGLIDSLARPGGNITGISTLSRELIGKLGVALRSCATLVSCRSTTAFGSRRNNCQF